MRSDNRRTPDRFRLGLATAFGLLLTLVGLNHAFAGSGWKAGTATSTITPETPIWMAGYASRDEPSQGALHDIWAKALALEGPDGQRAVLVTLDLCGISRNFSLNVRKHLIDEYDLERDRIVLACSHTHSGPVVGSNLITMYPVDEQDKRRIEQYTKQLGDTIVDTVGMAIDDLSPAELAWGVGRARFAVNRRENDRSEVNKQRDQLMLKGPVDHDVPVIQVKAPDGSLRGIVFGYACHCTVLSINKISGDYAGYAMIELEREHPDAVAYFVAGCGGDQNPMPRRKVELAEDYGRQLAEAVDRTLNGPLRAIEGPFQSAYEETDLSFDEIPPRAHWEQEAESDRLAVANRARDMLSILDEQGTISQSYPYPVQAWQLGSDLTWIFLGGEVVVDFSRRIKRNLGGDRCIVSAYCNDVMAYIPSLRVLKEGGYEGATAMIYYGQPAAWAEDVEERVISAVDHVVDQVRPDSD